MRALVYVPIAAGAILLVLGNAPWLTPSVKLERPRALGDGDGESPLPAGSAPADLRAAAAAYMPDVFSAAEPDAPPLVFLPEAEVRNPCWRRPSDRALRCLPLVHVLGGYQCAAADLFARVSRHADFARPAHASPSFYFEQAHSWADYVKTFRRATEEIGQRPAARVTGEGSAGMLSLTWTHSERLHQPYIKAMGARWQLCNANRTRGPDADARFNACMAAHISAARAADAALASRAGAPLEVPYLLRAVQGTRVRLVALLRNPTDRLYAAYWHYPHYAGRFGRSERGFAAYHTEMEAHVSACAAAHGVDACALRFESLERRFERVFYHVRAARGTLAGAAGVRRLLPGRSPLACPPLLPPPKRPAVRPALQGPLRALRARVDPRVRAALAVRAALPADGGVHQPAARRARARLRICRAPRALGRGLVGDDAARGAQHERRATQLVGDPADEQRDARRCGRLLRAAQCAAGGDARRPFLQLAA